MAESPPKDPKETRSDAEDPEKHPERIAQVQEYWRTNVRLVVILLSIWFLVSYVAGVLVREQLDAVSIVGFPLGFWFAQQGSIYIFVILIFVYAALMNRLDRRFDVDEK